MSGNKQINRDFWLKLDKAIEQVTVPQFSNNTVRPCAEEDFIDFKKTFPSNFDNVISLLDVLLQDKDQRTIGNKKKMVKVVAIIGEQNSEYVWNTSEIVEVSKTLKSLVCQFFEKNSISEIFDDDIFLALIMYLRPKLLKDTWKSYPGAVVCYKWLLQLIEKPFLKQHVTEVLPTALIIFDDYVQENQALGLECISVIIDHCQKSRSLKNMNYDEVIFQALEKATLKVEPNMIIPLYTCIANLLENIRYCEDNKNTFGWSKQDDILANLLDHMELQSNLDSRYAYIVSLNKFFTHSGIGKWSERLTRILSEYCEDDTNLTNTSASLDLVKAFLSIYHPKGINFYTSMYCSLLKLQYNHKKSAGNREIVEKTDQCLSLLSELCPNLSKEIMENDVIKSIINVK